MASSKRGKIAPPAEKKPAGPSARTKLEKFVPQVVERLEIKNAPYNPRVISDAARARLRKGLKKLGLLMPLVWNRLSGNLVGGHQRLSIMDHLEGGKAYTMTVSAVELSDKEEREANILLNNDAAMGQFDLGKLEELIKTPDLDLDAAGFERADLFRLFGAEKAITEMDGEEANEVAESLNKTAEAHKKALETAAARDSNDFYMVVVFKDYAERKAFTETLGLEDNRYQSSTDVLNAVDRRAVELTAEQRAEIAAELSAYEAAAEAPDPAPDPSPGPAPGPGPEASPRARKRKASKDAARTAPETA